jgi:E3 ubiquitin-protein ligase NRDP1
MYNDLDVQCVYFDKCNQTLKLVDLDAHEKICQLPKCENFELCESFIQNESDKKACSPSCLLLLKLKSANGDWKLIHQELKEYIDPIIEAGGALKEHSKNNSISGGNVVSGPLSLKWDAKFCGTNIALGENGTHAYLKESAYIFRSVLAEQGFTGGQHYWEIHADPRTENELKIGISLRKDFDPNTAFCDFDYGYAYYGLGQLRHSSNANGNPYGKKFKKEGILGIFLDMTKGTLSFALNNEYFGVAFYNENLKKGTIWPAVALLHSAGCKIVLGLPVPSYFPK